MTDENRKSHRHLVRVICLTITIGIVIVFIAENVDYYSDRQAGVVATLAAFDRADSFVFECLEMGKDDGSGLVAYTTRFDVSTNLGVIVAIRKELRTMIPAGKSYDARDDWGRPTIRETVDYKAMRITPRANGSNDDSSSIYVSAHNLLWLGDTGHAFELTSSKFFTVLGDECRNRSASSTE